MRRFFLLLCIALLVSVAAHAQCSSPFSLSGSVDYPGSLFGATNAGNSGTSIFGKATGASGTGVWGQADASAAVGVSGQATSPSGIGIFGGSAHSNSGYFRSLGGTNTEPTVRVELDYGQSDTVKLQEWGGPWGEGTFASINGRGDLVAHSVTVPFLTSDPDPVPGHAVVWASDNALKMRLPNGSVIVLAALVPTP